MRIPATARYNSPGYRERFLSDMLRSRFTQLLREDLSPEAFVRASLGALEADFRRLALVALAEWSRCDIVSPELFNPVATLQRPSWGSWNGLLTAIRAARRSALRSGSPEQRRRVEAAGTLTRLLTLLDEPVGESVAAAIEPLADFVRAPAGPRVKLGAVLAMPISLRNRVAHDVPTDPDWWQSAADALRPLIEFQSSANPLHELSPEPPFPPPWFLEEGGEALAFHGVDRDFAALYTSDAGVTTAAAQRTQDVLLAFSRLLGKAAARETDFRRLLTRLAPQEIRGVTMGDWLVGPPVGQGGFAQVHVARQLSTGRKAAIKILRDGMDAETQQRFQQEASFLSRFRHPNIVNVYGFGQETWSAPRAFSLSDEPWFQAFSQTAPVKSFIAMEWIDGQTLDDVFVAGRADPARRPPLRTLVRWMTEAAGALSAVHATGLIHRDIKPHNLMVTAAATATTIAGDGDEAAADRDPRQVKLMDFGIARQQKAERTLVTERGRWLGTPAYMSPEQVRAGDRESDLGPAADIYSLCATFYELITGRRLFEHDRVSADEVQTSKLSGRLPDRPSIAVKGLPWEIETILLGGLEPEPSDRYRSMDELARDLQHWLADEPIAYRKPSAVRRAVLAYRRNRTAANLVAGFLLVAMIGVIAYIVAIRAEQDRTRQQRDLAVRNGQLADEQRALAVARERDARASLADLQVRTGDRLLQEGDAALAAVWYTRALPLTADLPDADSLARLRVDLTLRHVAVPVTSWNFPDAVDKPVLNGRMLVDGARVVVAQATRRENGIGGCSSVIDAVTGKVIATTDIHESPAVVIAAAEDGSRFASIAEGGTVRVYDGSGKSLSMLSRQRGVGQIGIDRHGTRLFVVTPRSIEVIDLTTGMTTVPPIDLGQDVRTATFSNDGNALLVTTIPDATASADDADGTVRLIDVATGKTRGPVLRMPRPWAIDIAADGSRYAVAGGEGARVYDADGTALTPPLVHAGPAISVQLTPDGQRVATSGSDRIVRLWKVDRQVNASIPLIHPESAFAMAFNDDGTRLLTLAYDGRLRMWDAATGRPIGAPLTLPDRVLDAVSPTGDRDRIRVLTMAGVTEWSYAGFADPGDVRVPVMSDVGQVAFDPTSTWLACNSATGRVRVLRVSDGSDVVAPLIHPKGVSVVQFAPDGRRLLTAGDDGAARVWALPVVPAAAESPATGPTTISTTTPPTVNRPAFELHHRGLRSAMLHPDGRAIVTAGDAIRLWNATTGDALAALVGFGVRHVKLSADGRWLAAGCSDGRVLLWAWPAGATPSPKPTRELNTGRTGRGTCAALCFSPDGRLLLAAFEQGPLRLWDVATGDLAAEPQAPTAPQELAFSRDGRRFLAAGYSATMHLYDTASPAAPSAFVPGGTLTSFGVFHPNGHAVYAASMTGRQFFDLRGQPLGLPLQSQPLGRAEVSPDGRWLATIDQSVRLFDLSPQRHSPADLQNLASLLAGRLIDDTGVVRPLDAARTTELRQKVRSQIPEALSDRGGRDAR